MAKGGALGFPETKQSPKVMAFYVALYQIQFLFWAAPWSWLFWILWLPSYWHQGPSSWLRLNPPSSLLIPRSPLDKDPSLLLLSSVDFPLNSSQSCLWTTTLLLPLSHYRHVHLSFTSFHNFLYSCCLKPKPQTLNPKPVYKQLLFSEMGKD